MKSMLSFEISDELKEKLRVEAFNKKMNISKLIRFIIENYFNGRDNENQTN